METENEKADRAETEDKKRTAASGGVRVPVLAEREREYLPDLMTDPSQVRCISVRMRAR